MVNTLNGNDQILGSSEGTGIYNSGEINTDKGNDRIIGKGDGSGIYGIYLDNSNTTLNTGDGSDLIVASAGDAGYGLFNFGTIDTGKGDDRIVAKAGRAGIVNYNTIVTEEGNDLIRGSGIYGINHTGTIDTGKGNDRIIGKGIDPFSGFDRGGSILLGEGDDLIKGFGAVEVNDEQGFDTAKFDFNSFDLNSVVELGSGDNTVELIQDNMTMTLANIESFVFADGTFSFDELIA